MNKCSYYLTHSKTLIETRLGNVGMSRFPARQNIACSELEYVEWLLQLYNYQASRQLTTTARSKLAKERTSSQTL